MLEILNLAVQYGQRPILKDVSLRVEAGEVVGLVGPNGAGKSTLIRAVSGVVKPHSGRVRINGQNVENLTEKQRARFLAVVPQARYLPGAFSVYQTVLLGRTPYLDWLGRSQSEDEHHVQQALAQTQTQELAERLVGQLSGGEQQRVLLARALAQDTPVLLLDEPTTHLDLQHQSGLLNLVRSLAVEKKIAVLMVLHDLNLTGLYADRVALLAGGKIRAAGAPADVLTERILSEVYRVPVQVVQHPYYGTPLVLPDGIDWNDQPVSEGFTASTLRSH